MKVVVLGASGMLGSMILREFGRDDALEVTGTTKDGAPPPLLTMWAPRAGWAHIDVLRADIDEIARLLEGVAWAINAVGVIKPYIRDADSLTVQRALQVNALFPHRLARAAERTGCRALQIATDCVYSGAKGSYREADPHDAHDVYGKTKSLGEVHSAPVHHLRCSIIGPELKAHVSLLDWFLGLPRDAEIKGFANHLWNGVSTLAFARLCRGIVRSDLALPHLHHVVPKGCVSKLELLQHFAREYDRMDITISPYNSEPAIDRTLSTDHEDLNRSVWQSAGFAEPPDIVSMIADLAKVAVTSPTKRLERQA